MNEEDIYIYEWGESTNPDKYEVCIMVKDLMEANNLKTSIIVNQKLRKIVEESSDFYDGRFTEVIGRLCRRMLEDAEK